MLFQTHDVPETGRASKWKGERLLADGPFAVSADEWFSAGEIADLARGLARHSEQGLAKVAAVLGPTVRGAIERLLRELLELRHTNEDLVRQVGELQGSLASLEAEHVTAAAELAVAREQLEQARTVEQVLDEVFENAKPEPEKPAKAKREAVAA